MVLMIMYKSSETLIQVLWTNNTPIQVSPLGCLAYILIVRITSAFSGTVSQSFQLQVRLGHGTVLECRPCNQSDRLLKSRCTEEKMCAAKFMLALVDAKVAQTTWPPLSSAGTWKNMEDGAEPWPAPKKLERKGTACRSRTFSPL